MKLTAERELDEPAEGLACDPRARRRRDDDESSDVHDLGRGRAGRDAPADAAIYEAKGLVRRWRTPGNTPLLDADLERLRAIQRLTTELGLNLAGAERVLELQDEVDRLRGRIERLERDGARGRARTASTGGARPLLAGRNG